MFWEQKIGPQIFTMKAYSKSTHEYSALCGNALLSLIWPISRLSGKGSLEAGSRDSQNRPQAQFSPIHVVMFIVTFCTPGKDEYP